MSDATTALAEVLRAHTSGAFGWCIICEGSKRHNNRAAFPDHLAAAVVAAVRGLSPDLQAELIGAGASVERGSFSHPYAVLESTHVRVVGPWTPEQAEETS